MNDIAHDIATLRRQFRHIAITPFEAFDLISDLAQEQLIALEEHVGGPVDPVSEDVTHLECAKIRRLANYASMQCRVREFLTNIGARIWSPQAPSWLNRFAVEPLAIRDGIASAFTRFASAIDNAAPATLSSAAPPMDDVGTATIRIEAHAPIECPIAEGNLRWATSGHGRRRTGHLRGMVAIANQLPGASQLESANALSRLQDGCGFVHVQMAPRDASTPTIGHFPLSIEENAAAGHWTFAVDAEIPPHDQGNGLDEQGLNLPSSYIKIYLFDSPLLGE